MADVNIQELNSDEIEHVSGGVAVGIIVVAAIAVAGFGAGVYSGYKQAQKSAALKPE